MTIPLLLSFHDCRQEVNSEGGSEIVISPARGRVSCGVAEANAAHCVSKAALVRTGAVVGIFRPSSCVMGLDS